MFRIPKQDPIGFLMERKFPNYKKRLMAAQSFGRGNDLIPHDISEKLSKGIAEYEAELKAMSRDKLSKLFEKEQEAHRQELKAKAEEEERQQFFNLPFANADFEHWSKATYWTLDEAIALLLGRAPEVVSWERIKDISVFPPSPFVERYKRIRDLVIRAKNFKALYDPTYPGQFLAWARRNDFKIPEELETQVEARGILIADWKDLHDKLQDQNKNLFALCNQKDEIINVLLEEKERGKTRIESEYWEQLEQKVEKAIAEYPSWSKTQRKIQKTGNLQDWLTGEIGLDNREAEIIKKVLSDSFDNLN